MQSHLFQRAGRVMSLELLRSFVFQWLCHRPFPQPVSEQQVRFQILASKRHATLRQQGLERFHFYRKFLMNVTLK